jgi:hypothetical protein
MIQEQEAYNVRFRKCKTQFQNIRNAIIEGKNSENIFRELMDTKKCDHIYSFKHVRNVAFKKMDFHIKEKLDRFRKGSKSMKEQISLSTQLRVREVKFALSYFYYLF